LKKFSILFLRIIKDQLKKASAYIIGIIVSIVFYFFYSYEFGAAIGMGIFFFWVSTLIVFSNDYLALKELFFCLFSLQFLFGPALAYNGFDEYTITSYRMKISSEDYFSYTIPLFIAFLLGFSIFLKGNTYKPNQDKIEEWLKQNQKIPYYFIGIGFIAPLFSSYIPGSLSFVAYLFEAFKFIGLFILIAGRQKIKPILLFGIYGIIFISSFQGGMFHDLLIWIIVLGLILSNRYKPRLIIRLSAIIIFTIFASFIQSIKAGLRERTWDGSEAVSFELVEALNSENVSENKGFLNKDALGPQVNRINQGWILASTINNVPANEPHSNGALTTEYLFSAFMPRFLAPNKLRAGDQAIFNKYSGHSISDATAMGLGLFSDAYVEFGRIGAIFYIFLFGVMYGYILNKFLVYSENYPILILFSVLAFIYPIRPDCETQTALGHLFKTIILLSVLRYFFNEYLVLKKN
jgi:hypothetical protein